MSILAKSFANGISHAIPSSPFYFWALRDRKIHAFLHVSQFTRFDFGILKPHMKNFVYFIFAVLIFPRNIVPYGQNVCTVVPKNVRPRRSNNSYRKGSRKNTQTHILCRIKGNAVNLLINEEKRVAYRKMNMLQRHSHECTN